MYNAYNLCTLVLSYLTCTVHVLHIYTDRQTHKLTVLIQYTNLNQSLSNLNVKCSIVHSCKVDILKQYTLTPRTYIPPTTHIHISTHTHIRTYV